MEARKIKTDWRALLKIILTGKQISQRAFCKKYKLHYSAFSCILAGKRGMPLKYAIALEEEGIKTAYYWLDLQTKQQLRDYENKQNIQK